VSLVERGFVVGWTTAGAWAARGGSGDACSAAGVASVAAALLEMCRAAPPLSAIVEAPAQPSEEAKDVDSVVEAFLGGLRDRDALAALAHAHPWLFPSGPREPTSADLDRAIDAADARPVRWKRVTKCSVNESVEVTMEIETPTRAEAQVSVYLAPLPRTERYTVRGYTARGKLVVGMDFPRSD
jgi:hypothetical protein